MKDFDLVVIGAGPGGYVAALRAAQFGKRVAVVEKKQLGGTCLNVGCIPSKTFLKHSEWALTLKEANRNGLKNDLLEIDLGQLIKRKEQVVGTLQGGIRQLLKKNAIDYYEGEAILAKNGDVQIGSEYIHGDKILLATGSHPFVPSIEGLQSVDYLTTDTFFDMKKLPKSLVIIGGGVIAIELAFAMAPLGVEVSIVEVAPDVLLTEDEDARRLIKAQLKQFGVTVITQANIKKVVKEALYLSEQMIPFDQLLVATGRKANLEIPLRLGLKVTADKKFLSVNTVFQTSQPSIYAVGDVVGGLQLAHAASEEGLAAVSHMFAKEKRVVDNNRIPRCLYTFPEVASVGLSEQQAKELGREVTIKSLPFAGNGKAISALQTQGFVKLITDKTYGEILGAVIVGVHATEMIHTVLAIMASEGTVDELASMVFAHPTLSEILGETAKSVVFKAVHE